VILDTAIQSIARLLNMFNQEAGMPIKPEHANIYPTHDRIEKALLMYIYCHGDPSYAIRCKETYEPLAVFFNLLEPAKRLKRREDYSDNTQDSPAWDNQVQWARRGLKKVGYLAPSPRGIWRLSDLGIRQARNTCLLLPQEARRIETIPRSTTSSSLPSHRRSLGLVVGEDTQPYRRGH
jgi:hypothetical protein